MQPPSCSCSPVCPSAPSAEPSAARPGLMPGTRLEVCSAPGPSWCGLKSACTPCGPWAPSLGACQGRCQARTPGQGAPSPTQLPSGGSILPRGSAATAFSLPFPDAGSPSAQPTAPRGLLGPAGAAPSPPSAHHLPTHRPRSDTCCPAFWGAQGPRGPGPGQSTRAGAGGACRGPTELGWAHSLRTQKEKKIGERLWLWIVDNFCLFILFSEKWGTPR